MPSCPPQSNYSTALNYYQQALALLPALAVNDLAVTHNQLGNIYGEVGDTDHASPHYREAIRYYEKAGNLYGAGRTRYNVGLALEQAARLVNAREYALAGQSNFQTFGDRAADMIQLGERKVADIERAIRGG